ncbi:MAG: hypothetical protein WD626_05865 [Bauldia sp.]
MPRWPIAPLLSALLLPAAAGVANAAELTMSIGEIEIRHDDTRFRTDSGPGSFATLLAVDDQPGVVVFHCIDDRNCFGDPLLTVSATPVATEGDGAGEALAALVQAGTFHVRPLWGDVRPLGGGAMLTDVPAIAGRDFGGLTLHGTVTHSNCRASTPANLRASGVHNGIRYTFSSGFAHGCGGFEGFSQEMFEELLGGITLAAPDAGEP